MTKQRHSGTSLPPSRLCRLLILALGIKLLVLAMLIIEPSLPDGVSPIEIVLNAFSSKSGRGKAIAATDPGAGAPPAVAITPQDARQTDATSLPSTSGNSEAGATSGAADNALPPLAAPQGKLQDRPDTEVSNGTNGQLRDTLARRQEDLARKEQELRALENDLNNRLEQMKILENRLATMIKEAEGATDAKFRHLVDVLSNMKAKQAAAVLETLDPKIAVKVLAGMRGRQAGEILTFVKPEVAAQLTESLARLQLPLE